MFVMMTQSVSRRMHYEETRMNTDEKGMNTDFLELLRDTLKSVFIRGYPCSSSSSLTASEHA